MSISLVMLFTAYALMVYLTTQIIQPWSVRMFSDSCIGEDVGGSVCDLTLIVFPASAWREWGKPRKKFGTITGSVSEIWTHGLPITQQEYNTSQQVI